MGALTYNSKRVLGYGTVYYNKKYEYMCLCVYIYIYIYIYYMRYEEPEGIILAIVQASILHPPEGLLLKALRANNLSGESADCSCCPAAG